MRICAKGALLLLGSVLMFACQGQGKKAETTENTTGKSKEERYRPYFHFTPEVGWMNDPNGLFYFNGYYHLYYQHYPDDNVWGPMHWGHATSRDLINWKHQPIAMYPDSLGYIFSGSAVVDVNNSSGFGKDGKIPIVAMYTYHDPECASVPERTDCQTQAIAYSLDEGMTWTKYEGNPVIESPGIRDFRDPKVIWDQARKEWLMVLAADDRIMAYSSGDLKNWKEKFSFGSDLLPDQGVWECPDFFPMELGDTGETKWVMIVSIGSGAPDGSNGTEYFIGNYNGSEFTLDEGFATALNIKHDFWIDFGRDAYAGVTWDGVPEEDGRRIFVEWMSDAQYGNKVPTGSWRSTQSIPRELDLELVDGIPRLRSVPVTEITHFRTRKLKFGPQEILEEKVLATSSDLNLTRTEIQYELEGSDKGHTLMLSNDKGENLKLGYLAATGSFFTDRSQAGENSFSGKFGLPIAQAPRFSTDSTLRGTVILDKTSVEMFMDDGSSVLTNIFFPGEPWTRLTLIPENNPIRLNQLEIHELNFQ